MPKFPWPTVGGHDFWEVMSAMQKSTRRGLEEEALHWASELYLSQYEDHVWSRMQIIATEDIGIADSNVCVQIATLRDLWKARKSEPDARLYFVHAVLILVRAPKSRIVDHALMMTFAPGQPIRASNDRPVREIPDWALDKHTTRGKALGHGVEHFFDEGAKLVNETLPDPYRERAKRARMQVTPKPTTHDFF